MTEVMANGSCEFDSACSICYNLRMGRAMSRRRRIKRHHLKRFAANVIGASRGIDKQYFREAAQRAQYKDEFFTKVFNIPNDVTHDSANARRATLGLSTSIQHSSREEVLDNIKKDIQQAHMSVLLDNRVYHKLCLCWNSEYTRFYFMRNERNKISTSISYPTRERAMRAFKLNRIYYLK